MKLYKRLFTLIALVLALLAAVFITLQGQDGGLIGPVDVEPQTSDGQQIPVLAYHSIKSAEFYYPINADNPWILLDDVFRAHMQYLYDNNFTPLTSNQLINYLYHDGGLPQNPIIITFDDGYLDNYLFAAPIMREFGFSGIVFLITNAIHDVSPEMAAYPTHFIGLDGILASQDVFEFGSHTHAMHRAVDGVPPLAFESVSNIRADLRQSFAGPLTFTTGFAYPHGLASDNAIEALKAEDVLFAFITRWGYVNKNTDPFLLPRFSIESTMTMEEFSEYVWGRLEIE